MGAVAGEGGGGSPTGFGDFIPATPTGHAIAVIEMLTGQLYLVTVIGLLIGSFASRRRAA